MKDETTSRAVDHDLVIPQRVLESNGKHGLTVALIQRAHPKLTNPIFAQLKRGKEGREKREGKRKSERVSTTIWVQYHSTRATQQSIALQ